MEIVNAFMLKDLGRSPELGEMIPMRKVVNTHGRQ
jgi:hypothetical protein